MSLLDPHNLPFAAALAVMLILAVIQMVGIADVLGGHDADVETDNDLHAGPFEGVASLLGIGRMPFTIWLALFLLIFAGLGVSIQEFARSLTGGYLDTLLGAVIALVAALPATGMVARPFGVLLPKDESSAVTLDALVGRRARITDGTARAGSPARARVLDRFGMMHHVMVLPHEAGSELPAGEEVLLVWREGETFAAAAVTSIGLSPE